MQLKAMIEDSDYPIDVYAVYASDNRDAWQEYVSENFPSYFGKTIIRHLWDPELDSDFQRKYGVIQTPRMFLIAPDGTIIGRSLDVPALKQLLSRIYGDVELEYGTKESTELFDRLFMNEDGLSFRVTAGQETFSVSLALEGKHYLLDALAAVSAGLQLGVTPERIADALGRFRNMAGRQEIFENNGITIIKDCYNAGPESMAAALTVLGKKSGSRIAVLGDMLELGKCAPAEHYRIGRIVAECADMLFAYGPNGPRVVSGAVTGGMSAERALAFDDRVQLAATLKSHAKPGDVLLFKGSHGMHMELALELFLSSEA
jgi:UDP-N-acetylmuramyl pentapeptide synthase